MMVLVRTIKMSLSSRRPHILPARSYSFPKYYTPPLKATTLPSKRSYPLSQRQHFLPKDHIQSPRDHTPFKELVRPHILHQRTYVHPITKDHTPFPSDHAHSQKPHPLPVTTFPFQCQNSLPRDHTHSLVVSIM